MKKWFVVGFMLLLPFIFVNCSGGGGGSSGGSSSGGAGYTYSTTSNKGDYAEWTFTGSTLTATWKIVTNTGAIGMTMNVNASCPTKNSTYGYYTCTINSSSSSCVDGTQTCSGAPSGSFEFMEVPGVAIFVHTSGGDEQLHVGVLKDSNACSSDVSGTYVYARTGLGQRELFGTYQSDSNLLNLKHADFAMNSTAQTTTPTLIYTTTDNSGEGSVTFTDGGCTGGVRSRGAGSDTLRAMMTSAGFFILDLPSGQGGIVSFKASSAATLADFAGKSFGGISFPDNGSPEPIAATSGAVSGSSVPITSVNVGGTSLSGMEFRPMTNTTSVATSPAFPSFTSAPSGYSTNTVLSGLYAAPSNIPGLFRIDGTQPDTGRVLIVAAKLNGKVIGFGSVYNWRTTSQINPSTGSNFTSNNLYNTGSFILFER